MFKVNNKDTRTTWIRSFWVFLLTLIIFHTFFYLLLTLNMYLFAKLKLPVKQLIGKPRQTSLLDKLVGEFSVRYCYFCGLHLFLRLESFLVLSSPFWNCKSTINETNLWTTSLREKSPNTKFFLLRKSPYSVRIRENADQKKLRIWTLFTRCFGNTLENVLQEQL